MATFYKIPPEKKDKGKQKARRGDVSGHTDEVLALALSGDGKYLASGGKDRKVGVWDVERGEWVKGFGGHKDTISVSSTALARSFSLISIGSHRLWHFARERNNYIVVPSTAHYAYMTFQ